MGDTVFSFGKHRGRSFQEVHQQEPGYVRWATELPSATGQLKEFIDFCKDAGPAAAGPAAKKPAAPPAPAAAGSSDKAQVALPNQLVPLAAELCSTEEFRIVPEGAAFLPQPVWKELTQLAGATLGPNKREWRFSLSSYDTVMQQIRSNLILATCELEPLPPWLLNALRHGRSAAAGAGEEPRRLLQEYLAQLPPEVVEERPVMEFQKQGILFGLSREGRCLLGDEMGLGKTLQALAIIAQYQSDWPVLVVVPSALRMVWRDQALAWLPHLLKPGNVQVLSQGKHQVSADAKIVITSYDLLSRNARFQVRADGEPYQAMVVDEAHFIKDPKSKRTGVVLQLCRKAVRCVLISGTPAVNRAVELFTQLQALLPANAIPGVTRYCERYCERQEQYLPRGARVVKWVGAKRKAELNVLLTGTVMIRRLKSEVLTQLPKKRRQRITLDASKLDGGCMKELGRFLNADIDFDAADGLKPEVVEVFKKTAEAKVEGVAEYAEYLLSNDVKFLLFGHHHVMLDGLEQKLKALNTKYIRIDGKTAQEKRAPLVEKFQKDDAVRVALLSITACGQGLTLTAAHTVVFAELYWVPGQMMQAEDRVHRIGQTEMVDVHYCIAEGTLDERVFGSLNKKNRDTSGILDGAERCLDAWKQTAAPKLDEAAEPRPAKRPQEAAPAGGIAKYFKSSKE